MWILGLASTLAEQMRLRRRRRGEYSGKDLEAVMSRTVLVKPLASMLRIYPNVYEPGVTCEEVAPHPLTHVICPAHGPCISDSGYRLCYGSA